MYQYMLIDLGGLAPGYTCNPTRINASGRATGSGGLPGPGRSDAILSSGPMNPQLTDLGLLPGATSTQGIDLNASADVAGQSMANGLYRAARWSGGTATDMHPLFAPWAQESACNSINDQGDIVGEAWTPPPDQENPGVNVGWLYRNGNAQNLTSDVDSRIASALDINNGGQIVGATVPAANAPGAFIYDAQQGFALIPCGPFAQVHINEFGLVAGYDDTQCFTWQRGQANVAPFHTNAGAFDGVYDVNAQGLMVGRIAQSNGTGAHGFISDGTSVVNIDDTLVNSPGWSVNAAIGINDTGLIVGTARQANGAVDHGVLLIPYAERLGSWRIGLVARILFGIINDAGGVEFIGNRPVPVPPWGPVEVPVAESDMLLAFCINELAGLIRAQAARSAIQSAATKLMVETAPRLNAPQSTGADVEVAAAVRARPGRQTPDGKRIRRR